jgi:hypothetical protein
VAGRGGAGSSSLTVDDTLSTNKSFTVTAASTAAGGTGGTGGGVSAGATGGAATASLTLTGAHAVNAASTASGGHGGFVSGSGAIGAGGAATATTVAKGTSLTTSAVAHGGVGGTVAGLATATTTTTGSSGTLFAEADTGLATGQLIQSVSASAAGVVNGTSTVKARAGIAGTPAAFTSTGQAIAFVTGAPNGTSTAAVLAANSKIAAAFGSGPVFFAIGELGGGVGGLASAQTATVSFDEAVDLTKLASRKDLVVGLYNGAVVGSGFTSMTFDLFADGVDFIHQTFTSAAAAKTFFTNHAFDLGSLASGQLGANTLTLHAVMSITTVASGSGFYGDLIIGDPPGKAAPAADHSRFVEAMAGFGGDAAADLSMGHGWRYSAHPMIAAPSLHAA